MKVQKIQIGSKKYLVTEIKEQPEQGRPIKPERLTHIKNVVALATGVTNINEATRKRSTVMARQMAHFFAWLMYNAQEGENNVIYTFEEIGHYMGYKDHATALHSVKSVKTWFKYKEDVAKLREIAEALKCSEDLEKLINETI